MSTIAEYQQAAERHRPADPAQLAIEVQRLALQGLTLRDIASAMRLDLGQVAALLVRRLTQ